MTRAEKIAFIAREMMTNEDRPFGKKLGKDKGLKNAMDEINGIWPADIRSVLNSADEESKEHLRALLNEEIVGIENCGDYLFECEDDYLH